jgi:hypothetical protein
MLNWRVSQKAHLARPKKCDNILVYYSFVWSVLALLISILYTIANNLTFITLHETQLLGHLHGKYSSCQH